MRSDRKRLFCQRHLVCSTVYLRRNASLSAETSILVGSIASKDSRAKALKEKLEKVEEQASGEP